VLVGDFFADPIPALVSHRASRDAEIPLTSVDQLIERLVRNVEFVAELGVTPPSVEPDPLPFPQSNEEIEASAVHVRQRLEAPTGALTDLATKAELLGASTFCLAVDGVSATGAMVHLPQGAVVFINGTYKHGPRRITLAHEVGHLVFADEYSVDHTIGDESGSTRERKLDRFGRALLMPLASLTVDWATEMDLGRSHRDAAIILASHYRVGTSQLAQRLAETEILSRGEANSLRHLSTTQSDFYEFDLLATEELQAPLLPAWYRKGVIALYRKDQISAARAVSLLVDTLDESELPEPPLLPSQAVWSVL